MENNQRIWIWVLVAVAILSLLGSFGMGGYGMMGFGMGFGFLVMILFWGAVIWLVYALFKASQSRNKSEDTRGILRKRFAKGEITKKQYEEMKKELTR